MAVNIKKEKLMESVQSFLMILNLLRRNKFVGVTQELQIKKRAMKILEDLSLSAEGATGRFVQEFNLLIKDLNSHMKGVIYPEVMVGSAHNFMRNEIVSYELFINQLQLAKIIDYAMGGQLFKEAAFIWDDIAYVAQRVTMEQYNKLVIYGNEYLPEKLHFPVPRLEDFPKVPEELDKAIIAPHIKRVRYAPPGSAKNA